MHIYDWHPGTKYTRSNSLVPVVLNEQKIYMNENAHINITYKYNRDLS